MLYCHWVAITSSSATLLSKKKFKVSWQNLSDSKSGTPGSDYKIGASFHRITYENIYNVANVHYQDDKSVR